MSVFEEMHEFEKKFSELALELSETLEKAEQLSNCIEDKHLLSNKNNGDYIRVNRTELLVDIRIIHDYIYKSYELANKLGDMI
jgi:hypothetical protein